MVKFNFVCLFGGGRRRRQIVGNIKKRRKYWKFMKKQNIVLCGELVWEGTMDLYGDRLWNVQMNECAC